MANKSESGHKTWDLRLANLPRATIEFELLGIHIEPKIKLATRHMVITRLSVVTEIYRRERRVRKVFY